MVPHLFCVHLEEPQTRNWRNSDSVIDIGFLLFIKDPLLISFFFFEDGLLRTDCVLLNPWRVFFCVWDWNLCFGEYCLSLSRPNLHKVPWMRSTCCWKISLSFKGYENGIVLLTVVRAWKTNDLLILTNPGRSLTMAELSALKNWLKIRTSRDLKSLLSST